MKRLTTGILWAVWLALLACGLPRLYELLVKGRDLSNYGSYIPWGLWVSAYIYFVGLSAGAFLLSSLVYVFGIRRLATVGRTALWLAVVTLLIALLSIFFDLGQKWRFWEVFTRPQWTSMMAWMVWLYTAYFILLLAELWLDMRCDLSRLAGRGGTMGSFYRVLCLGYECPREPEALEACHQKSMKRCASSGHLAYRWQSLSMAAWGPCLPLCRPARFGIIRFSPSCSSPVPRSPVEDYCWPSSP